MLFDKGKRFTCAGLSDTGAPAGKSLLRVCYLLLSQSQVWGENLEAYPPYSCKLLVNAPKSRFKHAVDRNRIKRLLREAFRSHKALFLQVVPEGHVLLLSLQFTQGGVSLPVMRQLVEKAAQTLQTRLNHA
ncbi:MAG: ribonuclease P protein component [Bacteroides sp.]|nr:ribonuclease P protein component [Bacteroides sp.]MCM1085523.1 ribonuclease P protein component [Bacteroides sp.]